jgi:hypothetical protein
MFRHPNPRYFDPKGKKKKVNMQFIFFMYKEFHPVLLSGLKIQNTLKNAKTGMSHVCPQLTRNFM